MTKNKMAGAQKPAPPADMQQPLSEEQQELVHEVYGRLRVFWQGCREMHTRARESRLIYMCQDPRQDEKGVRGRTIQLQTLKSTINNSIADQMDNMPEAMLLPETPELQEVADDATDAVRYVMQANDYPAVHRRLTEDFYVTGTSLVQVTWDKTMDYGKGNVALIRWPIDAFLWDPQCEDLQDSRAVFKLCWKPRSWFAAHYPEQAPFVGAEEYEDGMAERLSQADYDRAADEDRALMIEYWYRLFDADAGRYTINVAYCAGGALLDEQHDVYAHGLYPFVMATYNHIDGMPAGDGMAQELAPMMRYINRYHRYVDMNLKMSSKARMLTKRNANINRADLVDWSKDVIEGDQINEDSIRWLQHAPLNGMIVQMMLQMQTDMKQDSGQSEFARGETAGSVSAASAISMLQEAGSKITRLRTKDLNDAYKKVVEQVLWLMAEFYDDKRKMLITGATGEQREVAMGAKYLFGHSTRLKGAIQPPPYAVQVNVYRSNPANVTAQNELFIKAYSMAAEAQQSFPLSALFGMLNVDGKDRILPILREIEAQNSQMKQLAQQNEQLAQQNGELSKQAEKLSQLNNRYAAAMTGTQVSAEGLQY